jgi:hypothetical protein
MLKLKVPEQDRQKRQEQDHPPEPEQLGQPEDWLQAPMVHRPVGS